MDWWTTYAAAIHKCGKVAYKDGRGAGLHFQDYRGAETDFGYMVTSPYIGNCQSRCEQATGQGIERAARRVRLAIGRSNALVDCASIVATRSPKAIKRKHAYTDSASSATSMTAGIKTYNDAVNVDPHGRQVETIAHELQEQGWAIGVVTSVPISHATPACAYSHNVHRDDYQDLTRDLVGLPSVSHAREPLPGVDVLIGAGWGSTREDRLSPRQELSHAATSILRPTISRRSTPQAAAVIARCPANCREPAARKCWQQAADEAIERRLRLFGYFGATGGHLPFRTADGRFDPTISMKNDDKAGPIPAEARDLFAGRLARKPDALRHGDRRARRACRSGRTHFG